MKIKARFQRAVDLLSGAANPFPTLADGDPDCTSDSASKLTVDCVTNSVMVSIGAASDIAQALAGWSSACATYQNKGT